MLLSDLDNRCEGETALVIASGPSLDHINAAHMPFDLRIGVNYAQRLWACHYCVVVKEYIYADIMANDAVVPASLVVPDNVANAQVSKHYVWKPLPEPCNIYDQPHPEGLYSHQAGGTGAAIHLAYRMGCRAIFVIGADLGFDGEQYHAKGYWDTDGFKPMGWRKTPTQAERMFKRAAIYFHKVRDQLAKGGCGLYFLNPYHWRDKIDPRTT